MSVDGKESKLIAENESLKKQIKDLESRVELMKAELEKSKIGIPRLENICSELQNKNKNLKEESFAKMKNAEEKGKELANEVTTGMEFMQNVNSSLEKVTSETKEAKALNEELSSKLNNLKEEHEPKEEELKAKLEEMCDEVIRLRTEVAQAKLQNAEDKQRLFTEMQQLATTLIQSREQMKVAKETELQLRTLLQNYDKKFDGLQKSLKETNTAYDGFKGEMVKVCGRTQELEKETDDWKDKWARSNTSLKSAEEDHTRLQTEIAKAHDGLIKMTNLCRALQVERKELLDVLKRVGGDESGGK